MLRNLRRRGQRRQHVHKTEKLSFEMFIAHGPFHERAVKSFFSEKRGRFGGIHEREYLFAVLANLGFDIVGFRDVLIFFNLGWWHSCHNSIFPISKSKQAVPEQSRSFLFTHSDRCAGYSQPANTLIASSKVLHVAM